MILFLIKRDLVLAGAGFLLLPPVVGLNTAPEVFAAGASADVVFILTSDT